MGPDKLVFVGGAPRSGTTVTHALICSAPGVSAYHPEISFFRGLLVAFRNGRAAWASHTSAFFDDAEAFRLFIRETTDLALQHLWLKLGQPSVLALKDPHLTPFFPDLHRLYPTEAAFVTVCRHPFDVVRSRQEVQAKAHPNLPFETAHALEVAREYLLYYTAALGPGLGPSHLAFRYEDLDKVKVHQDLAKLIGVSGFEPRQMWNHAGEAGDEPWGSPKYNGPIDLKRRLSPLEDRFCDPVREICKPIMDRLGYS